MLYLGRVSKKRGSKFNKRNLHVSKVQTLTQIDARMNDSLWGTLSIPQATRCI